MREIRFRGKQWANEWVYGYLMDWAGRPLIGVYKALGGEATAKDYLFWNYHPVDPATVGQFTGLRDRNGTEIYEGDIVVAFRGEDCEEVNAVYYNANHCKWFLGSPYNNKLPMGLGEFCWLDLEVIGNIHDNPELLEVE